MQVPDVSYAQSGDVSIAYQAMGEGPPDLVFLPFLANIYTLWQAPRFAEFGRRSVRGRSWRRSVSSGWTSRQDSTRGSAQAESGEVLVSSTVKDLVASSEIEFEDRGVHELKGVPGEWRLYSVVNA